MHHGARSPVVRARSRAAARRRAVARAATTRSRWFRPWARCMTAICAGAAGPAARAKRVVVSIFVNPAQFAPHEDFASYPRSFDADLAALAEAQASIWSGRRGRGDVSGRLCDPHRAGGAGEGRPRRRVPPAFLRRRRDRGRQAADPVRARRRDVRREGLPAAQGGDAAGRRSRSAGEDRRRADRAREGRPRDVLAQRLPHAGRARAPRRRSTACSRTARDAIARRRAASRACSTKAAPRSSAPASRSTTSRRATPRRWRRSTRADDGPIRLLVAARIGKTRLIDNIAV